LKKRRCKKIETRVSGLSDRKQPPPATPITRSSGRPTHPEASGSTPGKEPVVPPTTMDSTLASIRSETVELIDAAIERSRATTHELMLSQFEQLSANLGPHRGSHRRRHRPTIAHKIETTVILPLFTMLALIHSTTHRRHDPASLTTAALVDLCVHKDPLLRLTANFGTSVENKLISCEHLTLPFLSC
jgi:hypothetical protein